MALRIFLIVALFLTGQRSLGQTELRGTVLNAYNNTLVPGAFLETENPKAQLLTDSAGAFRLLVDAQTESLTIRVKALGVDTSFEVFPQSVSLLELKVIPKGFDLKAATIRGLTARQVVQKAIAAIPQNYPDTTYVYYGLYRQYQQKDAAFQNLVEAQVAAAIQPLKRRSKLDAELLFAVLNSRRQGIQTTKIEDVDIREGLSEQLFEENPVYFLSNSSLAGRVFDVSQFRFDSSYSGNDEYRIHYTCSLSSEDHGFGQKFATSSVYAESYETGMLIIDREAFAFKRIQRKAHRLPGFDYYHMNNWVPVSRLLTRELINGQLDVQYVRLGEKWFLSQICHGYSNDYFSHPYNDYNRVQSGTRHAGQLGEFFEWQTSTVSRNVPEELAKSFTSKPYLQFLPDTASGFSLSENHFPFLFFPEETVKTSLANFRK